MPSRPTSRTDIAVLAGILALAFGVRLAWALYAQVDPLDGRFGDTVVYHLNAVRWSEGTRGFVSPYTFQPTALFPPGYPAFLAPLYKLFGPDYQVAEIANVVLGTISVALVYVIALQLFDIASARIAAFAFAIFPGQVFFTSLVYSETLFVAVMLAAVLALIVARRRVDWRVALVCGMLCGAATMVRSEGVVVFVAAPLYLLLSTRDLWSTTRLSALVFIAAAMVIGPWTVRNTITLDSPVLVTTAAGINLYQGHHPGAEGDDEPPDKLILAYGPISVPGGEVAVSNGGVKEALGYAGRHPVDELALSGKKLRYLYAGDRAWLDLNEDFGHRPFLDADLRDQLRVTADVYYFTVLALGALAVLRWAIERGEGPLLPLVLLLVWSGAHIVMFGAARYHVPIVPMFCLLAGYGLAGVPSMVSALVWRRPAAALAPS